MTLSEPIPQLSEYTHPDYFDIIRVDAQYRIESSADNSRPEVMLRSQQIHGQSYVDYGYFDASGLTEDGRLVPELDGTRSSDDGHRIANYLVASEYGVPIHEAKATVRVLDIGEYGSLEDLPTYKYFAERFDARTKAKLANLAELYGKQGIREIAALGTVDNAGHVSSFELMRALIQNSIIKEEKHGYREVYLASLTPKSFQPVINFIDPRSANVIGQPVQIFSDDPRSRAIHVTPVLMDLSKALDNTVEAIESAEESASIRALVHKLRFLADGLDEGVMSKRVNAFLKKIA